LTRYLDTRPKDSEIEQRDLFGFRVKLPPATTSLSSRVETIPLSALPKDTTSELAGLSSHYPSFMLNVKQERFEYQLL